MFSFYQFKVEETLVVRNQVTHSLACDKRFIIMFSNSFKRLSLA